MSKRRSNKLTILIVPEDNVDPYSFRIDHRLLKVFYVVGIILVLHIIFGALFYWKFATLNTYTQQLTRKNKQLQEDNKRVISLAEQFSFLEKEYQKLRNLLGVNSDLEKETGGRVAATQPTLPLENIKSFRLSESKPGPNLAENQGRYLLTPKKSKFHEYAENIPTLLPVEGFLTTDFDKESWFVPKTHAGLDIAAKKGSVIRAAGSGVVIFANWTFDLGNLIIIDHGGEILSYYGHNQRLLKNEKDYVKKGEPIALLGTSGRSSGPHLHFEIWKDGAPVDPKEFILAFNDKINSNH
ncbi:MAG: peptidoglycan DD-metalloendopeptidase family protein [bacterium]